MNLLPAFRRLMHPVSQEPLDLVSSELRMPDPQSGVTPRDYQLDGAAWLYTTKRGILADDAGLGKTVQASIAAVKPVLVSCPAYVATWWEEWLHSAYPEDTVAQAAIGSRVQRHKALVGSLTNVGGKPAADWTIVTHDMMRGYYMPDVATWILDEGHHMRNREAERTREAMNYAKRVPRLYSLTATPVYKDVTDLWAQLHMLDPREWGSYWKFFDQFAKTASGQGWGGQKVVGIWNPKLLERMLVPYVLRRTYKDVGLFLPDVIDKDVILRYGDAERKLYNRVRDNYVYEDIPLNSQAEVLHTLRRCTVNIKITAAEQILEDAPSTVDNPTAIFCWYRDTAEDTAERLGGIFIHGDTPADQRADIAKRALREGRVIVPSMSSLSEGIDLSMCKQVIQLEEDYVPGRMYQERRRFQRWTKDERPIVIHNLRVANTVDMDVHHAVVTRRGSAQQILKDALT